MKAADKTISKRYARAYMDLDGGANANPGEPRLSATRARIEELEKVRNAASQFQKLFLHPLVGYDDKNEILARLLSKDLMTSRAAAFVRLLMKENRFYLVESVLEDCMRIYNSCAGIIKSEIYTRHPLSEEELRHIEKILSSATGKKAHISQIISERVIGGMEIRMGDLSIDATVRGKLEKLKRAIISF